MGYSQLPNDEKNHVDCSLEYISGSARDVVRGEYFRLYEDEGQRVANLYLLKLKQGGSTSTRFESPSSKKAFECAEVIRVGGLLACRAFFKENGLDSRLVFEYERVVREGGVDAGRAFFVEKGMGSSLAFQWDAVYARGGYELGVQFFIDEGLTVPTSILKMGEGKEEAIVARMIDPTVWKRKSGKKYRRDNAGAVYRSANNNICRGGEVYCPDFVVDDYVEGQKDSASFLARHVIVSHDKEELSLSDVIESTVANPENRRYEMTNRMAGMEDFVNNRDGVLDVEIVLFALLVGLLYVLDSYAKKYIDEVIISARSGGFLEDVANNEKLAESKGFVCIFFTLTSPSKYHRKRWLKDVNGGKGRAIDNPNYQREIDGVKNSPRVALDQQAKVTACLRSWLGREGIERFGFSVVEPHHDGTPHQHFAMFVHPGNQRAVKQKFREYALQEDGDELGASVRPTRKNGEVADIDATRRLDILDHDPKKGSVTAYMAKYISKGIAGFGIGEDFESGMDCDQSVLRVLAWKSLWGFRQFSFFGAPSITLWRELRKVKEPFDNEIAETVRLACDDGDWGEFTRLMNSDEYVIALQKAGIVDEEGGEVKNKYGEPLSRVVGIKVGNSSGVEVVRTRFKEWFMIDVESLEERVIDGMQAEDREDPHYIKQIEDIMKRAKDEKKVHRIYEALGGVIPSAVRYCFKIPKTLATHLKVYFSSVDTERTLFSSKDQSFVPLEFEFCK